MTLAGSAVLGKTGGVIRGDTYTTTFLALLIAKSSHSLNTANRDPG